MRRPRCTLTCAVWASVGLCGRLDVSVGHATDRVAFVLYTHPSLWLSASLGSGDGASLRECEVLRVVRSFLFIGRG